MREETGLDVEVHDILGMWLDTYGDDDPPEVTLNVYFLATARDPQTAGCSPEASEVKWFSAEEIPDDELAFKHVIEAIRFWVDRR